MWRWAECYSGAWIHRHGGYTFVVGKKHHHPPIRWIRTGNQVAYIPRHPSDVKGRPPPNLKYGLFIPKNEPNAPVEYVAFNPSQKYKLLSDPPKEFREIPYPHLAKVEQPEIQGHLLVTIKDVPIKYDYKTHNFVQAGTSAGGRAIKPVVVGGLIASGGYSPGGGGRGGAGGQTMHSARASGGGGRGGGGFGSGGASSGRSSGGSTAHSGGKQ
jgi:hypothetical protein